MAFLAPIMAWFGAGTAATAAGAGTVAAGTGVTAAGLGSGAIGTGLTAAELASAPVVAGTTTAAAGATAGTYLTYGAAALSALQGVAALRSGQQNAAYANLQAKTAIAQGKEETARRRRINMYQESQFRAGTGLSGTVGDASPMIAYLNLVKQGELEAQTSMYQGALSSIGYKQQAKNYRSQGEAGLFGGLASAGLGLGSTLLR